jgi:hypothetical protein
MARLGRVLVQVVSLASLLSACEDDDNGKCAGAPVLIVRDVPIAWGGGAGAGGAAMDDGAGGAEAQDCARYCRPDETCELVEVPQRAARCASFSDPGPIDCPPPGVAIGRRPQGVVAPEYAETQSLGAFFARVAHLEAASIHAFVRLSRELAAHGAGQSLVRRARAAARDEVRHARQMSRLARRYGAQVPRVELEPLRGRSVFELALENEVEGCVRETFGAVVALWQAEHAATAELRELFAGIARDETEHAELAWQLRAWLYEQLSPRERDELAAAQRTAFAGLQAELGVEPPPAWRSVAGLPSAATAQHLLKLLGVRLRSRSLRSTHSESGHHQSSRRRAQSTGAGWCSTGRAAGDRPGWQ